MILRQHATVHPQLPHMSVLDLQHLHCRIERHRSKPKNRSPPEYYQNLIERHDKAKTAIKHKYADATKDNLLGIKGNFIK